MEPTTPAVAASSPPIAPPVARPVSAAAPVVTPAPTPASNGPSPSASSAPPVAAASSAVEVAARLRAAVSTTMRGKPDVVDQALAALFGGGHVLVEDLPGTGKTLLAKSIAAASGARFGRVQCTPDLLPTDITGTSVYRPDSGDWHFRAGPVFANVVLVDEVNRASPRTQAALLEPMEERQVSVDGSTWALPEPFFCIATQNPFGQVGTFPLPESQLDRFALVMSVGLPDRDAEREILTGAGGVDQLGALVPVATPEQLASAIRDAADTHCDPRIVEYVLDLAEATRAEPRLSQGVSPRASTGLLHLARGHAVVMGRSYVTPDDVQAVAVGSFAHRVQVAGRTDTVAAREILTWMLTQVPVPRA